MPNDLVSYKCILNYRYILVTRLLNSVSRNLFQVEIRRLIPYANIILGYYLFYAKQLFASSY